ncbi:diguanylate cyclase [Methylomonas sp. AM2-LC]|uniref:diguanylate cyclase domain-containing protein n=1 Tax=Methylomonas sp. AM2-LC TaxID=3153301 RepID=UPI0032633A36
MKILLVEDTRAVSALMNARLLAFGYEVILAENGKIAVELFLHSAPDLVLMDIEMPVMNGFEATHHIRTIEAKQQWAWTPVIFLTSSDTVENLLSAIEAGGDDFIAKSVPEAVLQAKMTAMARIATLRQRLSTANRKLDQLANLDGLTGLSNRRNMNLQIDTVWGSALQMGLAFGLLMLDIDNFKKFNDSYGHLAGDECLKRFAGAITEVLNKMLFDKLVQNAFAARYGGEEFAVILPNVTMEAFTSIATTIVNAVRQLSIPHKENANWQIVTVSIGGTRVDVADGEVVALFHVADERLYRAKQNGRNRVEIG